MVVVARAEVAKAPGYTVEVVEVDLGQEGLDTAEEAAKVAGATAAAEWVEAMAAGAEAVKAAAALMVDLTAACVAEEADGRVMDMAHQMAGMAASMVVLVAMAEEASAGVGWGAGELVVAAVAAAETVAVVLEAGVRAVVELAAAVLAVVVTGREEQEMEAAA